MSLYVVSVVLALAVCWRLARLVPGGAQQFWLVLAGLVLPWGLIANILSIFHGLTPIGWVLAQAAIAASVFGSAHHWKWSSHPMVVPRGWNGPELALGGVLAAVLTALFMQQWSQPLSIGDDVRYHASRVLYWMGQQSIFPYTTHNDRQVYFAYQGELAFLWPILFTRMETAGRMIFWLASPFSCAALYMVARRVGASRTIALVVTIWFVVTPIVLRHGYGLKPEIWLTLYFLGAAWWLVEALETNRPADFILAGIFCTLAISSKLNLLAVVPALLAVPWITRGVTNPARSSRSLATGLVGASLLTGLALLLPVNMFRSGHPLGPAGMREVHSAPLSARQVRTHLARLPLLLFELPAMPWPEARAALENSGRSILAVMDADQPLPLERPDAWPGQFIFTVAPIAKTFSLGGIVLLLVLAFGAVRFGRELWRGRLISPQSAVWLLMASLLFGILLAVRWMVHSGLPERFLIPCFAVGMALAPGLIPERFRLTTLVAGMLLTAYYPLINLVAETKRMWISPPTRDEISAPFTEALDQIPSGSSILFFGSNDAPDYPLFGAASGYDRGVTPWGKGPFDAAALDKIVEKKQITHMLFQDRRTAYFHWDPPLALGPFVEWASGRSGSRVTPLESPFMVLVATPRGQAMQSRVAAPRELLTEAPAERPLLSIDRGLRGVVGIEGDRIRTPWPIETLGTEKKGFLWMGSGPDEGIRFRVWTKEARTVSMMLRAEAGPSRTDALRTDRKSVV